MWSLARSDHPWQCCSLLLRYGYELPFGAIIILLGHDNTYGDGKFQKFVTYILPYLEAVGVAALEDVDRWFLQMAGFEHPAILQHLMGLGIMFGPRETQILKLEQQLIGADSAVRDNFGRCVFQLGTKEMASFLFRSSVFATLEESFKADLPAVAASSGNLETLEYCLNLEFQARPDSEKFYDPMVCCLCIRSMYIRGETERWLPLINELDRQGYTVYGHLPSSSALHLGPEVIESIFCNNPRSVEQLIGLGASLVYEVDSYSPLEIAVLFGFVNIVRVLLRAPGDVLGSTNVKDRVMASSQHCLCSQHPRKLPRVLVDLFHREFRPKIEVDDPPDDFWWNSWRLLPKYAGWCSGIIYHLNIEMCSDLEIEELLLDAAAKQNPSAKVDDSLLTISTNTNHSAYIPGEFYQKPTVKSTNRIMIGLLLSASLQTLEQSGALASMPLLLANHYFRRGASHQPFDFRGSTRSVFKSVCVALVVIGYLISFTTLGIWQWLRGSQKQPKSVIWIASVCAMLTAMYYNSIS